jgi:hypothetical protein
MGWLGRLGGRSSRRLCVQSRSPGSERRPDLAHLKVTDPGGICLSCHEARLDGAVYLPSFATSHPDTHFLLRAGLRSAGSHREAIPGSPRRPHLVVDPAPAAQHPPGGHGRSAHRQRQDLKDPQSHNAGTGKQADLRHAPDEVGGNEASQNLARRGA